MKNKGFMKLLAVVCTITILTMVMVGCAKKDEPVAKVETKATETADATETAEVEVEAEAADEMMDVTISLVIGQTHNTEGLQKMFEKLEAEEGITVDLQVTPDDQRLSMLQMKMASGELSDVIEYNIPQVYATLLPEEYLYDFSGEAWASELLDPGVSQHNGKSFGFPLQALAGYQSIVYSKDVFDANGLSVPTTKAEFDNVCETLKNAGVTPILIASDSWVPQIWMTAGYSRAMGSTEAIDEMTDKLFTGKAVLNDYPQLAAVIDEILEMQANGYVNEDVTTLTWDESWVRMAEGTGAMLMGEGGMIGSQQATFPDTNFGVFNVPTSYDDKDILSGARYAYGFVVNKDTENIDAIKRMFEVFATPAYADMFFENAPGIPAFAGIDGGDMQADVRALYDSHQADGTLVSEMNLHWKVIDPLIGGYLWTYYAEALSKGNLTGAQIMDKFQEDINKYMKENEKPGF